MKYQVIYADPPWDQKNGAPLKGYTVVDGVQTLQRAKNSPRNQSYNTMDLKSISEIPVKGIVEKDSVLFMWTTNKFLLDAKQVIEAWGFKYVACITWKKKRMGGGLGGDVRITSEFLLFCRRGSLRAAQPLTESVIEAKREYVNGYPVGSRKPNVFRKIIEEMYPEATRLEMFAREHWAGWDVFGDQVENSIKI